MASDSLLKYTELIHNHLSSLDFKGSFDMEQPEIVYYTNRNVNIIIEVNEEKEAIYIDQTIPHPDEPDLFANLELFTFELKECCYSNCSCDEKVKFFLSAEMSIQAITSRSQKP